MPGTMPRPGRLPSLVSMASNKSSVRVQAPNTRPDGKSGPGSGDRPTRLTPTRILLLAVGAAVVIAGIMIGVSVAGSSSSSTPKSSSRTINGSAQTTALLSGIPQQGNALGKPNAPVTMVEFADPACPYCKLYAVTALPTIVQQYVRTGKVRLVYKGFDLGLPASKNTLRAIYAAGAQNRAWNLIDLLYRNQGNEQTNWAPTSYLGSLAETVPGLDTVKMLKDMTSSRTAAAMQASERTGRRGRSESDADLLRRPDRSDAAAAAGAEPRRVRLHADVRPAAREVREGRLRAVIAALALAGGAIAAYLTYTRYSGTQIACSTGGCETVQHSRYAVVAGIPVAVLGLVGYAAILVTTAFRGANAAALTVGFAVIGLAFSAYLLVAQIALIHAICQWCVANDAVITLIAAAALYRYILVLRPGPDPPSAQASMPPQAAQGETPAAFPTESA